MGSAILSGDSFLFVFLSGGRRVNLSYFSDFCDPGGVFVSRKILPDDYMEPAATPGFTGADIAYTCQRAALLCVKEASVAPVQPTSLAITADHFRAAIGNQRNGSVADSGTGGAEATAMLLARAMN